VGAEGVISVASNLFVREVSRMVSRARAGDFAAAGRLHRQLYPLFKGLFIEPSPAPIKAALARAGWIRSPEVRMPLAEMSGPNRAVLLRVLRALEA
jgi:4-hydroxy-tetrahydrodipicolinate synthase